jgi:hypothetical protein
MPVTVVLNKIRIGEGRGSWPADQAPGTGTDNRVIPGKGSRSYITEILRYACICRGGKR